MPFKVFIFDKWQIANNRIALQGHFSVHSTWFSNIVAAYLRFLASLFCHEPKQTINDFFQKYLLTHSFLLLLPYYVKMAF